MLHSHSSQLWLDPLLVPLSFEPFLISALKKISKLISWFDKKWLLNFSKFSSNVKLNRYLQISTAQSWDQSKLRRRPLSMQHETQLYFCRRHIKTRATIIWNIEPLNIVMVAGHRLANIQACFGWWLKKNSHDNKNLLVWDYHEFQLWRLTNDLFGRRTSCVLVVAVMLWEELGKLVLLSCCMSSKLWSHNYTWPLVKKP